jgi:hypothetical protein
MFSFFKKKTEYADQAFLELAEMLTKDRKRPTYKKELIDPSILDYSLGSLAHLENFLDLVRNDKLSDEQTAVLVLRCGAYLGEVVRRQSQREFHWLRFDEAAKLSPQVNALGLSLGTSAVLFHLPDEFTFPLSKVGKYIQNGEGESIRMFAAVLIQGIPGVKN